MANEHPFQMLFETLGRLPAAHADPVNRRAYEILSDILTVPVEKPGRCILLRAPRAGHGKTHLLSRIQHQLGSTHEFIPLHAAFGCQIDASTVIDDTLRRLLRPLPASGGLCVLDLVARRLFATALQPLVGSGEVPCQDREGALTALRTRPIETFDFHHPNAVTAHWTRENFEVLGQRLSMELAQRCDLPIREVSFWVDTLFRFAATPVENPVRLRVLGEAVHTGDPGAGVMMERLEALLGMLSLLMRVVLVADELEGFSTDETAALRLAAFLGSLRQSVERLDVILSLNQDIWESAFVPRLSDGLADRLSEVVVELTPLTEDEMVALLESRVPGLGARVLERVDRASAGSHARGLIRAAGIAWLKASAMDSQSRAAAPPPPAAVAAVSPPEPAPARYEPAPEPPPAYIAPEPVPVEAAEPAPSSSIAEEVSPQPASSSLFAPAEPVTPDSWPAPEFSNEPAGNYSQPIFEGNESPPPQPLVSEPVATADLAPEPVTWQTPEVTQESSVYCTAPATTFEPGTTFVSAAPPEPEPVFESSDVPASPEAPDTDRVDDLLKQFRERYGRGSM